MGRLVLICECHSLEHQLVFWYDEESGELYCEPHLVTHRGFLKRLWTGLKYAFGYKSRYGQWDSTIFKEEDLQQLKDYLDKGESLFNNQVDDSSCKSNTKSDGANS